MKADEIFARRLRNARVMAGYSMDDLVREMGNSVSKMTISKLERQQIHPSSSIVMSLSDALRVSPDYFFRPFTAEINSIRFRSSGRKMSAKEEKTLKNRISDMIEKYLTLEEICNASVSFVSPVSSVITDGDDARKAAETVRRAWALGTDGIVSVVSLLEEKGIKVLETEAPLSFDGLSAVVNDDIRVVVLNSSHFPERRRFTACHELGHLVLSFDSALSEKEEEKLCHVFASELLLPESVFRILIGTSRASLSYQEMKTLQLRYGISCDALMYKAMDSGIISESKYRAFWIHRNTDTAFRTMVEKSCWPEDVSSRYSSLVFRALSDELITLSKAAELLGESVESIREKLVEL
jgi:Zn-dependent peptidase ImmA (M78 family)/transcriptional regulator with XRE-family HTH domain